MKEFIWHYWIQELFALMLAIGTGFVRGTKRKKREYMVLKEAILALLHDRLYASCSFFLERGYCSLSDRNNLEYLYEPYKSLGGDGTGEQLYKKVLELPYEAKKEE